MPGTVTQPSERHVDTRSLNTVSSRLQLFSHLMSPPSPYLLDLLPCRDIFEKLKEAWMAARIATTVGHEHHGQF